MASVALARWAGNWTPLDAVSFKDKNATKPPSACIQTSSGWWNIAGSSRNAILWLSSTPVAGYFLVRFYTKKVKQGMRSLKWCLNLRVFSSRVGSPSRPSTIIQWSAPGRIGQQIRWPRVLAGAAEVWNPAWGSNRLLLWVQCMRGAFK